MLERIFCHMSGVGCLGLTTSTKQQKHHFIHTAEYMFLAYMLQKQFLATIKRYPHLTSRRHDYKVKVPTPP